MAIQSCISPVYVSQKVFEDGQKQYVHFVEGDRQVFDTKKAYRRALSIESGGAWIEERRGKRRYFVDESGWFQTSYKQVSKKEFNARLDTPSLWQKVFGVGLGILALAPGVSEFVRQVPKEAGVGLLALHRNNLALAALGCSFIPGEVDAQAIGAEFQVNTYTTLNQKTPTLAGLIDGGFIFAWDSTGQDGDVSGIFGQRYNANGSPFGGEFQANTFTSSNQIAPSVAGLSNGGYAITWYSDGQGGSHNVYAQRYNQSGVQSGGEFQVNTYAANTQYAPFAMGFSSGGFLIVWQSNGQDGDLLGIFGQRFDQNGNAIGAEFRINTYTTSNQDFPSAAELSGGGFIVIWESHLQDGDGDGIYGQRYSESSTKLGSEFQVHTNAVGFQQVASVAALLDGGFVVCWQSTALDGDVYGISAQRFDSTGNKVGAEFLVNTYTTGNQQKANVAALADGKVVFVWQSNGQDGSQEGIFGQRFDANLTRTGSEFQVNSFTSNLQTLPQVGALIDGGFVVAWESTTQDGSGIGIFAKRYDASGTEVPPPSPTFTSAQSTLPMTNTSSSFSSTATSTSSTLPMSTTSASPTPPKTTISILESRENSSSISTSTLGMTSQFDSLSTSGFQSGSSEGSIEETSVEMPVTESNISIESSSVAPPVSSGSSLPSLIEIQYGRPYSIVLNGETIGTFTFNGGTGQFSNSNPNTIHIEIDPSYILEDGATITLFPIPAGESFEWEGVTLSDSECFNAEGDIIQNRNGENSFQVLFSRTSESCVLYIGSSKLHTLPLLTTGGFV